MYQAVGAQLASIAIAATSDSDMDVFGRSAFNRFYYSTYLQARELLGQFDPAWRTVAHADVPKLLESSAKSKLKRAALKAEKSMPPGDVAKCFSRGAQGLTELARILREGYGVRVLADYTPETKALRLAHKITLGPTSLSSAERWPVDARLLIVEVVSSGRSLGIF